MALTQYTFHRGEPIVLGDRVTGGDGDPADYTMRARMKPAAAQHRDLMPGDSVAAIDLATTYVPAAGETAAWWRHSLSDSAALDAGEYLADSSLLDGAGATVWTSEPVRIILRNAASAEG